MPCRNDAEPSHSLNEEEIPELVFLPKMIDLRKVYKPRSLVQRELLQKPPPAFPSFTSRKSLQMSYRHQTPVPESNLNVPPLSSPLTPGNAARQASIEKVQTWTGAMTLLQDHLMESADILGKLGPLRHSERGSKDQEGLLRKLGELKDLQDSLDQMVIQAKSLSRTTCEDLESLGVTREENSIPVHALEEGLHEDLGDEEIVRYSDEADKASERLLEYLRIWSGVLNTHTEAASRIIIDCCMFHIIQLAEGFKFGQTVKGKTFLLPEVSILRSCKEAEAVDGGPMRSLLATAGRIDYVAVYIPDWQSMGLYGTTSIEGRLKNLNNIPATGSQWPLSSIFRSRGLCLSVIEAKRLSTEQDVLLEALPQAIAEALVLGHRSRIGDHEHRIVPFVLTNGARWIWGLLEPHASDGVPESWTCFRSEPHEIPLGHEALEGPESVRQEIKKEIRRLIDVLVYWTCAPRQRILNVVRKASQL